MRSASTSSPTHVALIRGINVGGKNPVPMARLRDVLTDRGLADVRTYIQSGNVLVSAPDATAADVTGRVETALREDFDVDTVVVTVTAEALRATVAHAPAGFGDAPAEYRYDVVFLRPPVDAADLHPHVRVREGVDDCWAGTGVLYFRRLEARRSSSYLSKILAMPAYRDMTIRNWRTTTTLMGMLDDA